MPTSKPRLTSNISTAATSSGSATIRTGGIVSGGGSAHLGGGAGVSVLDKDNPFAAKHTPILDGPTLGSGNGRTIIPAATPGMTSSVVAHTKQVAAPQVMVTSGTVNNARTTDHSSVGSRTTTTARIGGEKRSSVLDDPNYNPFNEKVT